MPDIVGVRFRKAGKIYYFDPGDVPLEVGNYVVAETEFGPELGWVVIAPYQVLANELNELHKLILRLARPEDLEQKESQRTKAEEALALARGRVAELGLAVKLASAEYNFDGSLLRIAFTAPEQVSFQELARGLTEELGTRVRFFQMGPRDEAKVIGMRVAHYGICGRCICCASWLTDFPNVTVKMARLQNMPMDSFKLSGACGRLLCCLTYEYPIYHELRGQLPNVAQVVTTPAGPAKVTSVDILRQKVTLWFEESQTSQEMTAQQLSYGTIVRPAELHEEEEAILAAAAARIASPSPPATESQGATSVEAEPRSATPRRRRRSRRRRRPTDQA